MEQLQAEAADAAAAEQETAKAWALIETLERQDKAQRHQLRKEKRHRRAKKAAKKEATKLRTALAARTSARERANERKRVH